MKRLIVVGLERLCSALDRVPWWPSYRCYPAKLSDWLDQRWDTGVWEPVGGEGTDNPGETHWWPVHKDCTG